MPTRLAAALLLLLGASPVAAAEPPSLVGTWIGHADGAEPGPPFHTGDVVLTIHEQAGVTFRGEVDFPLAEGKQTVGILGLIDPETQTISLTGGHDSFRHSSATYADGVIDSCYLSADHDGPDPEASGAEVCIRFVRAP